MANKKYFCGSLSLASIFVLTILLLSLICQIPASQLFNKNEGVQWYNARPAYGDGFASESLPPVFLYGRELSLSASMQPTFINEEDSNTPVTLQIRLFDAVDNSTVTRVTYVLLIGKIDRSAPGGMKVLLNAGFYSESGPITLDIVHYDKGNGDVIVNSTKKSNFDAWVADPVSGKINLKTPLSFGGGLYYVGVVIATMDNPDLFFKPEAAPKFTAGLSIGFEKDIKLQNENEKENESTQGKNATVISYYDKVTDLNFNSQSNSFAWSMPFDWNSTKISAQNNILVHNEIKIPKSMLGSKYSPDVKAIANGKVLSGRNLALDPYSLEDYLTVHYILNKQDILDMSKAIPNPSNMDSMAFSLYVGNNSSTVTNNPKQATNNKPNEIVLITDKSGVQATLYWDPSTFSAGKSSKVGIKFTDAISQTPISTDVVYGLRIIDSHGNDILARSNLTAKAGTDEQEIQFPDNATYYVELDVKGFVISFGDGTAMNNSNSDVNTNVHRQNLDTTRAGIARGTVVVPEFPLPFALAIMAITFIILISLGRYRSIKSNIHNNRR